MDDAAPNLTVAPPGSLDAAIAAQVAASPASSPPADTGAEATPASTQPRQSQHLALLTQLEEAAWAVLQALDNEAMIAEKDLKNEISRVYSLYTYTLPQLKDKVSQ